MRVHSDSQKPVVLLATAERWTSTARLAMALRNLGCEIALLAPGDHPATVCGAVTECLRYDPLRPLHSLQEALQTVAPTTILPADETVTCQLGELWTRKKAQAGRERERLCDVIQRSLGDPDRLCETGSRMALQRAAEAEGVPTPATMEIAKCGDLAVALEQLGSPMMLKADASSGGRGVRTVASLEEAEAAWRAFSVAPHVPRALLRGVLRRDWTHLRPAVRRERRGVTAQKMVVGPERTAMVVGQRGELLACELFEVVHTWKLRGPSSVLRRVEDPTTEAHIRALLRRMKITGFAGFDFIVDRSTSQPLLLERNARPTQVAHLSFGGGHDLAAAYVRAIVGRSEVRDRAAATARPLIALFPHELQRDPESPSLREAFHDVPWESPELMQRALRGEGKLWEALQPAGHESGVSLQVAR